MYYGPTIILGTGLNIESISKDSRIQAIVLNIPLAFTNAAGSLFAVFYLDKKGRRFIMLRSLPGVILSCILISISFYLS